MKNLYKKTNQFLFVLLFISNISFAQDTIFYKNATKFIAIIKEVSTTEIQYKKLEMPDGPTYIVSKNEVDKIIYKNGFTDVINAMVETPSQPLTISYAAPITVGKPTINYDDTKLKHKRLMALIDRHPNAQSRIELMNLQRSMRSLKASQDATRTVAIVFGGIAIATGAIAAFIYAFDNQSGETFAVFPGVAGAVAVITGATAISLNINLRKKRHAFVDIYNK